jgi:hypothetical protein
MYLFLLVQTSDPRISRVLAAVWCLAFLNSRLHQLFYRCSCCFMIRQNASYCFIVLPVSMLVCSETKVPAAGKQQGNSNKNLIVSAKRCLLTEWGGGILSSQKAPDYFFRLLRSDCNPTGYRLYFSQHIYHVQNVLIRCGLLCGRSTRQVQYKLPVYPG